MFFFSYEIYPLPLSFHVSALCQWFLKSGPQIALDFDIFIQMVDLIDLKWFIDLSSQFIQYTWIQILKSQLEEQLQGDDREYRLFIVIKVELP